MFWLWFQVALGCGGMFGPDDAQVFSASQQAIFERHGDHVTVDYLVDTSGELSEFGWVIPVPGPFRSLDETDPERFATLRALTHPEATFHTDDSQGGGCSGGAKSDGGGRNLAGGTSNEVTVVAEGVTGVFEYVALQADSTTALVGWLDDHGWVTGDSFEALDAYVLDGGWQFVAVAAVADSAPGPGGAVQSAISIAYEGGDLVYPARMSQQSMAPSQSTTIYVVGDERATLSGWAVTPFADVDEVGSDWLLDEALADLSDPEPTYAEIWADTHEGQWVTRFDTVAASALHEHDVDLTFMGGQIPFHPSIDLYESEEAQQGASGGCAVGRAAVATWAWLPIVLLLRRRQGS